MNKSITILTGFIHDFAAGCWAATILAIYWLHRLHIENKEYEILIPLEKDFFLFGLFCVGLVFITGIGRTFTYIENIYGPDAEKLRKKMLIIKHILLFIIYGTGILWQYSMVVN